MAHNVNLNIHYSAPKEVWDESTAFIEICHTGAIIVDAQGNRRAGGRI